MGETSRLAGSPINGDADIDDVADFPEEAVEFAVGDVEGQVADEEGAAGVGFADAVIGEAGRTAALVGEGDGEAAAFEHLLVEGVDGCLGGGGGVEGYVAEAGGEEIILVRVTPSRVG